MHQEINQSDPGRGGRIKLFFLLIFALIVTRLLMGFTVGLPYAGLIQALMLTAPFALFLWIYKRRLSEYRYTLFNKQPDSDELDEYGDRVKLAHPLGTLILERVNGRKARVYELISPAELVALLPPDAEYPERAEGLVPLIASCKKSEAHTLVYRREGKLRALRFAPSMELEAMLEEILSAVQKG